MPSVTTKAPGKSILFGEHSVVYNRPAIAVPINQVHARAVVQALINNETGDTIIEAGDIGLKCTLSKLSPNHPIASAILLTTQKININSFPPFHIRITSTIPIAAGLGSGAAITVAIVRAVSAFLGKPLSNESVNQIAFEVDKIHHGNPSGVDNTVITYGQPVFFTRGNPFEFLHVKSPFTLVVANTGIQSSTAKAVAEVRARWEANPTRYNVIFDRIGSITRQAREQIENGNPLALGPLMNENHSLLQEIGVSSKELDCLVSAALTSGAAGAKLCGSGQGGNMIALVDQQAEQVADALRIAGATSIITTTIQSTPIFTVN